MARQQSQDEYTVLKAYSKEDSRQLEGYIVAALWPDVHGARTASLHPSDPHAEGRRGKHCPM